MAKRDRGQCDIHGKLRFHAMPEIGSGGANGKVAVRFEECPFLRGCRGSAGGAGEKGRVAGAKMLLGFFP
jgi:hypothetical protein